jgi:hypothetical protein
LKLCNEIAQYPTPVSGGYLQGLKAIAEDQEVKIKKNDQDVLVEAEGVALEAIPDAKAAPSVKDMGMPTSEPLEPVSTATPGVVAQPAPTKWSSVEAVAQVDLPDVPLRFPEKRRPRWSSQTCTRPYFVGLDWHNISARPWTIDYRRKSCKYSTMG